MVSWRWQTANAFISTSQRIGQESRFDETGIQIRHSSNRAARLAENYQQTRRFEDLEEAVGIMERAVDIGGGSIQPDMLSNLGAMLGMRFERTGSMDDIN